MSDYLKIIPKAIILSCAYISSNGKERIDFDHILGSGSSSSMVGHSLASSLARSTFDIFPVDIDPKNVHILNGNNRDLIEECKNYEDAIKAAGGIELFLAGIGEDGHIAFNEPGMSSLI